MQSSHQAKLLENGWKNERVEAEDRIEIMFQKPIHKKGEVISIGMMKSITSCIVIDVKKHKEIPGSSKVILESHPMSVVHWPRISKIQNLQNHRDHQLITHSFDNKRWFGFSDIYCYQCSNSNYSTMNKGRMEYVDYVNPDKNQGWRRSR